DRARAVIGHRVDDHRRTADAIALVAHLLVGHSFELTRAAPDRVVDRVLRHVLLARLVDGEAKARIGRDVAPAESRRDGDLLDQAREDLAALRVGRSLAMLDVRPLAVAGHGFPGTGPGAGRRSGPRPR